MAGMWESAGRRQGCGDDGYLPSQPNLRALLGRSRCRCTGRVQLRITAWPSFQPVFIQRFHSKQDVIDACLASGHLPFLLDGRLAATVRGAWGARGAAQEGACPLPYCRMAGTAVLRTTAVGRWVLGQPDGAWVRCHACVCRNEGRGRRVLPLGRAAASATGRAAEVLAGRQHNGQQQHQQQGQRSAGAGVHERRPLSATCRHTPAARQPAWLGHLTATAACSMQWPQRGQPLCVGLHQ